MTPKLLENEWFSVKYGVFRKKHFCFVFFSVFLNYFGNRTRYQKKQAHRWILHWKMHQNILPYIAFHKKKIIITFYLMICDFSKKNLIRKITKTWCSGENGGQIRIQHKKLLWKWHISSHEHIVHFCWPVYLWSVSYLTQLQFTIGQNHFVDLFYVFWINCRIRVPKIKKM